VSLKECWFRCVLAALALGVIASCGSIDSNADNAIDRAIEKVSGANPCNGPKVVRRDFALSAVFVNDAKLACTRWVDAMPGFVVSSGKVSVHDRMMPIVIHRRIGCSPDASTSSARRIFVRIVGGPGGDIAPNDYDLPYAATLGEDDLMISVGYTGTRYGTWFPKADFKTAAREVALYTSRLHAQNPKAEIVLMGLSLGGPIAVAALSPSNGGYASKLILVAPLLWSAEEAEQNFATALRHDYEHDVKLPVDVLGVGANGDVSSTRKQVNTIDLFSHFFDSSERETDLPMRLAVAGTRPTLIVYGRADRVIGLQRLMLLDKRAEIELRPIVGMAHIVDPVYFKPVAIALRDFVSQCHGLRRSSTGC
jgi:pimeloyl-ACP methyl ester carboxylesterase